MVQADYTESGTAKILPLENCLILNQQRILENTEF